MAQKPVNKTTDQTKVLDEQLPVQETVESQEPTVDQEPGIGTEPVEQTLLETTQADGEKIEDTEQQNQGTQIDPVLEENKPDETEESKTVIEKPEVEVGNALSIDDIKKLLLDGTVSIEDKLKNIAANGPIQFKFLASKLLSYESDMQNINEANAGKGGSKNFDLFNAINKVLGEEDYNMFKVQFDIINLAFIAFKDSSFDEVNLQRFDYKWPSTDSSLKSYTNLVTIISILADASTRKNSLGKINFTKAFRKEETVFTTKQFTNITTYYEAN